MALPKLFASKGRFTFFLFFYRNKTTPRIFASLSVLISAFITETLINAKIVASN